MKALVPPGEGEKLLGRHQPGQNKKMKLNVIKLTF